MQLKYFLYGLNIVVIFALAQEFFFDKYVQFLLTFTQ